MTTAPQGDWPPRENNPPPVDPQWKPPPGEQTVNLSNHLQSPPAQPYVREPVRSNREPTSSEWQPQSRQTKKKRSWLPWLLALLALLALIAAVWGVLDQADDKAKPKASATAKVGTKPSSATGLRTQVNAGTWTAGKDIKAGTWGTSKDAGDDCYFQVTNKDGEMDPKRLNLGGGKPTFKIADGEKVTIRSCPGFALQK